jgi:hypothetical protein
MTIGGRNPVEFRGFTILRAGDRHLRPALIEDPAHELSLVGLVVYDEDLDARERPVGAIDPSFARGLVNVPGSY